MARKRKNNLFIGRYMDDYWYRVKLGEWFYHIFIVKSCTWSCMLLTIAYRSLEQKHYLWFRRLAEIDTSFLFSFLHEPSSVHHRFIQTASGLTNFSWLNIQKHFSCMYQIVPLHSCKSDGQFPIT
jgi:hypothetical protein